MFRLFALTCRDCPDSQLVALIFIILSVAIGIFIAVDIKKRNFKRSALVSAFTYIINQSG